MPLDEIPLERRRQVGAGVP